MSKYNSYGGVNCREGAMRMFQSDLNETDKRKVTYVKGKDGKLLPALPDDTYTDYVLRLNDLGEPEWGTFQALGALPDGGEEGEVLTMTENGAAWEAIAVPEELRQEIDSLIDNKFDNVATDSMTGETVFFANGAEVARILLSGTGSGSGDMEKSVYDTNNSGVVDDADRLGGVLPEGYVREAPDQTTLESSIEDTNVTTGQYKFIFIIAGRTYFLESGSLGIKVLNEATGEIEDTNITSGSYTLAGLGSDGRTYFCSNSGSLGIKFFDEATGNIVNTNITSGKYAAMGIGSDGKTYFCSFSNLGIRVLNDATGQIEHTNITSGYFDSMFVGVDGKTYFVGGGQNPEPVAGYGFWALNDQTGDIVNIPNTFGTFNVTGGVGSDGRLYLFSQADAGIVANVPEGGFVNTNITARDYTEMCVASDGKTYFCSNEDSVGIKVLNDQTGLIEDTNITTGYYVSMGVASDGRTYFLGVTDVSGIIGIKVLNDATGEIEDTNVTDEVYSSMGIASDGKTYFGGAGIKVLNDATGQIENTNIMEGYYLVMGIASDGRTYFGGQYGSNGIKRLAVEGAGVCYVRKYGEWVSINELLDRMMIVPDYSRLGEDTHAYSGSGNAVIYHNAGFVKLSARSSSTSGAVHSWQINGVTVYRVAQPSSEAVEAPLFPINRTSTIMYVLESGTFGEASVQFIPPVAVRY